jgi:hypothetical protein
VSGLCNHSPFIFFLERGVFKKGGVFDERCFESLAKRWWLKLRKFFIPVICCFLCHLFNQIIDDLDLIGFVIDAATEATAMPQRCVQQRAGTETNGKPRPQWRIASPLAQQISVMAE